MSEQENQDFPEYGAEITDVPPPDFVWGGEPLAAVPPMEPWPMMDPAVRAIIDRPPSHTDPNGSYTGKPVCRDEIPQQDADDL